MSILIETQNLSKYYGDIQALKNFTVKIESGAIGLLGPNGAGKSTLIKTLLGLIPATSGTGKVFSHDIFRDTLFIRQRIGYMPEHDCLLPDLNAVSYLSFLGELSGLSPRDSMQRSHEALYYVKIGDERYREISTYSTGMKQKVKLAQTLIHDPELIFLDEPTTGLDPTGRREMLKLVKGIVRDQGKNLIFSSHILPDIEQICDKVVILNRGELVTEGNIQDLLYERNPDLVIRVRGPIGKFLQLLRKEGIKPEKRKNDIVIKDASGVTKRVVELAAESGVQLRYLNSKKRSLEELFVKIIEKNEQHEDITTNYSQVGEY